ncbi:MAG: oxygen-dependent coproporphyrinogen oxidase [Ferruginibacter sp.]
MSITDDHIKEEWIKGIYRLQDNICAALELEDGKATFQEDSWVREEGGGGKTRVVASGNVFEKGGVNTSVVFGKVTDNMRRMLSIDSDTWFAAGISIVLHPLNPFVPTVHCNYRMFELYDIAGNLADRWFGGGTDLTPYYLFEEDARHFHNSYKQTCDAFEEGFYPKYKKQCDDYFVNTHRDNERRGIGGIFYDHERTNEHYDATFWIRFGQACGENFIPSYLPIVSRRRNTAYDEKNIYWQELRRGRYVEFNLLHDRGTIFGLKTGGRTESILMSLPPRVRFDYNYQPAHGSAEEKLENICKAPLDWAE